MAVKYSTLSVLVVAAVFRLLVFLAAPRIPEALTAQVEISTPISSYKRLREGLFLYERGVSPYDGGTYHQAPLLLTVFQLLPSPLVFTILDVVNALGFIEIAGRLSLPSPRFKKLDPAVIAAAYLFNPFTIFSCLGRSTSVFTNAAIIQAVSNAIAGRGLRAMLAIAMGTYLSMYPMLLLPPLLLMLGTGPSSTYLLSDKPGQLFGCFIAMLAGLLALTPLFSSTFKEFLVSCYGAQISVTDLTPNVGLWWYFFIEIFDAFRAFFIGVFWLHLVAYVGALTFRLPEQPLFVTTSLLGLIAIFKPYPGIADVSLYLGFLPLYKHILPLTRYTFLAASILLYATLLGPAFHYLWIYAGSGNANFFYAITLVWSLGLTMLVGDTVFAVLRDEWETQRPEMRGKDVRQI